LEKSQPGEDRVEFKAYFAGITLGLLEVGMGVDNSNNNDKDHVHWWSQHGHHPGFICSENFGWEYP